MKLNPYPMHGTHKVSPHRPPLRTLREMAEEFGITRAQLTADMRNSPVDAPEPSLKTHGYEGHQTWYEPRALRRWRREHLAAKQAELAQT